MTSGTTWHAAGLMVTFGSMSQTSTELRKYTRDLYASLEAETGLADRVAPVRLHAGDHRPRPARGVPPGRRVQPATVGSTFTRSAPREIEELWPLAKVDDVLGGFYVADDGRVNPVDVTMSLAKGARMQGVKIFEGVTVTGVRHAGGAVTGVRTDHGDIEAEYVVNCAGCGRGNWARWPGSTSRCRPPSTTTSSPSRSTGIIARLPVLEDPSSYGYYREEGSGLMIGLFEAGLRARGTSTASPTTSLSARSRPTGTGWRPYLEKAMSRVPDEH